MAKGPFITDRIRQLIATEYINDPGARAKEIQSTVNKKLNGKGPGLSAVQKELAKMRKRYNERPSELKELDRPWSTASLVKYPIQAEALPTVLQLWVWIAENIHDKFTIREALWAARFYTITKDLRTLAAFSRICAVEEIINEILGEQFKDSFFQDLIMFGVVTGQEITYEREKQIIGPLVKLTDKEWAVLEKIQKECLEMDDNEREDINEPEHEMIQVLRQAIKRRRDTK